MQKSNFNHCYILMQLYKREEKLQRGISENSTCLESSFTSLHFLFRFFPFFFLHSSSRRSSFIPLLDLRFYIKCIGENTEGDEFLLNRHSKCNKNTLCPQTYLGYCSRRCPKSVFPVFVQTFPDLSPISPNIWPISTIKILSEGALAPIAPRWIRPCCHIYFL